MKKENERLQKQMEMLTQQMAEQQITINEIKEMLKAALENQGKQGPAPMKQESDEEMREVSERSKRKKEEESEASSLEEPIKKTIRHKLLRGGGGG